MASQSAAGRNSGEHLWEKSCSISAISDETIIEEFKTDILKQKSRPCHPLRSWGVLHRQSANSTFAVCRSSSSTGVSVRPILLSGHSNINQSSTLQLTQLLDE